MHRLFRRRAEPTLPVSELAQLARSLVRADEQVDVADLDAVAAAAATLFASLRGRADVAAVLAAGVAHYEVPFSFHPPAQPGTVVRGAIDCVVAGATGALTILEFKTGRPRFEHEAQVAIYAEALRAAAPGCDVSTRVVYPEPV